MDAKQFLAEFSHIVNAPNGVQHLRELILQLAVTGRLIKSDDNLSILPSLEKWKSLKIALIKKKIIPKQTDFLAIKPEDKPFALPHGWIFVRLGEIAIKIGSGSTPRGGSKAYVNTGVPFLRSQNVWNHGLQLDDVAYISLDKHEAMKNTHVMKNDLLLNITGASLGRCALFPDDLDAANVSQHVSIIRPIEPEIRKYLHLCILSPYTQKLIWGRQVGMAREGLSKKVLEQFEIPLPPLEEQSRIVAKVDELMVLCNKLEAQQQKKQKLQSAFAKEIIASLTGIPTSQQEEPATMDEVPA